MKKKKNNPFKTIFIILVVIFSALLIASTSGYYESRIRDQVVLTEEGIKEFEERISKGEKIDLTSFLEQSSIDYSSSASNLGDNITKTLEGFLTEGVGVIKNIFNTLF